MSEESKLYFRKQGSWFKELLYKIKILKPKYKELGKIKEINIKSSEQDMKYTDIKLTEEQRLKLQALYEAENPKPRNREERRRQKFGKKRGRNE